LIGSVEEKRGGGTGRGRGNVVGPVGGHVVTSNLSAVD